MSKHEPFTVYLADVSYYSGKLEAYLRYKEIPFERNEMSAKSGVDEVYRHTGVRKVPAVKTQKGLWLKDTTPMLTWFESEYSRYSIVPVDPTVAFVSTLVEDYADEWCWRSAMYHRWATAENADYLGQRIGREVFSDWPIPVSWSGAFFKARQRRVFLKGDGLSADNEAYVSGQYSLLCDAFSQILQRQDFLLGNKPTLVDFAFMGPFFRHYFCDPVPGKFMRDHYPDVLAWVTRVWCAKGSKYDSEVMEPSLEAFQKPGWDLIFKDLLNVYLPYLHENAKACSEARKHFDFSCDVVTFKNIPAVRYRTYCLEMLEKSYQQLDKEDQSSVKLLCEDYGELTLNSSTHSGLLEEHQLPLKPRKKSSFMERLSVYVFGTPWDMKQSTSSKK